MGPKISVIIPTRGMVHARCVESVLSNIRDAGVEQRIVFQTGLPIPDCFNVPIEEEMRKHDPDYIWLVEEDVEVPYRGLEALLASKNDVSAIDYPFPNGYGCVGWYRGKPMWCGTGCTLIASRVFSAVYGIPKPWFRSDVAYEEGEETYYRREGVLNSYGAHDINFGLTVLRHGFTLGVVPSMTAFHWKMKKAGTVGSNKGVHQFEVYDFIKRSNVLKNDPRRWVDRQ